MPIGGMPRGLFDYWQVIKPRTTSTLACTPNALSRKGKESMPACYPYSQDLQVKVQVQVTVRIEEACAILLLHIPV
jgi:hypothetical protein